jgi:hypothetical protein
VRLTSALLVLTACSHTIAPQKPRAWFSEFDPLPASEPLPPGMGKPRPKVFAVGARIPIGTSWSAICKTPSSPGGNYGETQWEIHECNDVPHDMVLLCDNPACRVEPPAADERPRVTTVATLTEQGSYPMRVQFIFNSEGDRKELKLPPIEAVFPDDAAVRCVTDDVNITVEVTLLRNGVQLPGSPALALSSGASCKAVGTSFYEHTSIFECPLQSPGLAQWVDGKVIAPNIKKQFNASCERRPRP